MADVLEDDDGAVSEHHFGRQEWDRLEDNFINVRSAHTRSRSRCPRVLVEPVICRLVIGRA